MMKVKLRDTIFIFLSGMLVNVLGGLIIYLQGGAR